MHAPIAGADHGLASRFELFARPGIIGGLRSRSPRSTSWLAASRRRSIRPSRCSRPFRFGSVPPPPPRARVWWASRCSTTSSISASANQKDAVLRAKLLRRLGGSSLSANYVEERVRMLDGRAAGGRRPARRASSRRRRCRMQRVGQIDRVAFRASLYAAPPLARATLRAPAAAARRDVGHRQRANPVDVPLYFPLERSLIVRVRDARATGSDVGDDVEYCRPRSDECPSLSPRTNRRSARRIETSSVRRGPGQRWVRNRREVPFRRVVGTTELRDADGASTARPAERPEHDAVRTTPRVVVSRTLAAASATKPSPFFASGYGRERTLQQADRLDRDEREQLAGVNLRASGLRGRGQTTRRGARTTAP